MNIEEKYTDIDCYKVEVGDTAILMDGDGLGHMFEVVTVSRPHTTVTLSTCGLMLDLPVRMIDIDRVLRRKELTLEEKVLGAEIGDSAVVKMRDGSTAVMEIGIVAHADYYGEQHLSVWMTAYNRDWVHYEIIVDIIKQDKK